MLKTDTSDFMMNFRPAAPKESFPCTPGLLCWVMASLLVAGLLLFPAPEAAAQSTSTNVGSSGAQFLKINAGARAEGMGGAFTGRADDATAAFWNPAGIVRGGRGSVSFTNIPWWADVEVNQLALAMEAGSAGHVALSIISLRVPEQEITTVDQPDGTGRFFDAGDLMIGLSFARYLLPEFSVGVSAKYVNQRIWNEQASGLAFDIGTQYNFGFRNLTLGMAVSNFGADMSYSGSDLTRFEPAPNDPSQPDSRRPLVELQTLDYPLPLNFQVGLAADVMQSQFFRWGLAADLQNPNDNKEMLNLGNELEFATEYGSVFLRGGYKINNPDADWALGSGLLLDISGYSILVDYAYSQHTRLPGTQRLSIGLQF